MTTLIALTCLFIHNGDLEGFLAYWYEHSWWLFPLLLTTTFCVDALCIMVIAEWLISF